MLFADVAAAAAAAAVAVVDGSSRDFGAVEAGDIICLTFFCVAGIGALVVVVVVEVGTVELAAGIDDVAVGCTVNVCC